MITLKKNCSSQFEDYKDDKKTNRGQGIPQWDKTIVSLFDFSSGNVLFIYFNYLFFPIFLFVYHYNFNLPFFLICTEENESSR